MERILIIGSCGAGKSTIARQLATKLQLPLHHLDRLYWRPGWIETPREEFRSLLSALVTQQQWIIDGNYSNSLDIRLSACDTVIYLELSRWHCLWGVIKRWLVYRQNNPRPDMGEGCPERFDWEFIKYVWHFPNKAKPRVDEQVAKFAKEKRVICLKSRKQIKLFLAQWQ